MNEYIPVHSTSVMIVRILMTIHDHPLSIKPDKTCSIIFKRTLLKTHLKIPNESIEGSSQNHLCVQYINVSGNQYEADMRCKRLSNQLWLSQIPILQKFYEEMLDCLYDSAACIGKMCHPCLPAGLHTSKNYLAARVQTSSSGSSSGSSTAMQ